jgi:hypothetical protein
MRPPALAAAVEQPASGDGGCARARLTEPITDRETLAVAERFGTHGLLEHVARARKRALGSHFPRTELG